MEVYASRQMDRTGQHSWVLDCQFSMGKRTKEIREKGTATVPVEDDVYTQEMPKWRRYYLKVRKNIRFPRYYKKALNW